MRKIATGVAAVRPVAGVRRVLLCRQSLVLAFHALTAITAVPLSGQLPSTSAADLGLGGARAATVSGFAAIATNPAGLGMSTRHFSLSILPVGAASGLDPVQLVDLANYADRVVPHAVREEWLNRVSGAGRQSGSVSASISGVAVSLGNLGLQLSTSAGGLLALNPDATELLLFGNAGRTGEPRDLALEDSRLDGFAISTLAVAYAERITRDLAVGVTIKFMAGNGVVVARDAGSAVSDDPVSVSLRFPTLLTASDSNGRDSGSGVGVDLGVQWRRNAWQFGGTFRNALNSFEWDLGRLAYRPGTALFDGSDSDSDFEERPGAAAPARLLTALGEMTPARELALGAAWKLAPDLRVSGDLRKRFGDGPAFEPAFFLGAGAEFTGIGRLPLRVHAAHVSRGLQFGGGFSLVLGPVHTSWAIAARSGDLDDEVLAALSISFGSH